MSWSSDLVKYATAALEAEDRRLRLLYCTSADKICETPAICLLNEHEITGIIIAVVASRLFRYGDSLRREEKYPDPSNQRADFAVKEDGPGTNWAYVEVKGYKNLNGKSGVAKDIDKLQGIKIKVQRWVLIYRLATPSARGKKIEEILSKNFPNYFSDTYFDRFETVNTTGKKTCFEIAFCRIRNK